MPNTKLILQYRTADVSISQSVVVPGLITSDQIQALSTALIEDGSFIARQVGLPSPWEKLIPHGFDLDDDVDHVYTRILGFQDSGGQIPVPADFATDEPATHPDFIEQLVHNISMTTFWDIEAELAHQAPFYKDLDPCCLEVQSEPQMAFRAA